jgi:hypothetical protein
MAATTQSAIDEELKASHQFVLRFSGATTAAFVFSEAIGSFPSFLAPLLAGAIMANSPVALTPKLAAVLAAIMSVCAGIAFMLPALLAEVPQLLVIAIGLVLFLGFALLAQGKAQLPVLLMLICIGTIPVFTLIAPQYAGALPIAYSRGMIVAVIAILVVQAIWPLRSKAAPAPPPMEFASPIARAATGTAIILPLMLVYLMFGISDALPVLITTTLLVSNFDPHRGAMQGVAMVIGNFVGGVIAIAAYMALQVAPSLTMLGLITLIVSMIFGMQIAKGGAAAPVALITFNQFLVILGLALLQQDSNSGLWLTRLFQFTLAVSFAIAVMVLIWGRPKSCEEEADPVPR